MVVEFENILGLARRPSRYIGGEVNSYNKPWDSVSLRWCLVFPDVYEVGMSHIGLEIIYHCLNGRENILADRAFAPWVDMEALMREHSVPLWSLESRKALNEFDVIGFTLPYELTYTNILNVLDLGRIPLYSKDRTDKDPIILGGGVGAFNPEPVAPFFDAIILGDGEESVIAVSEIIRKNKGNRSQILSELNKLEFVYVPSIKKDSVKKCYAVDLDKTKFIEKPLVPFMQVIHDRVGVEIQRGCNRGCRFCQAGYIYRPVRQRSPEKIRELALQGLKSTGNEELSFLSLSAGDYLKLPEVMKEITDECNKGWVNISLPSLRVETLTPDLIAVLKRSLHGGFTLAPEAATERLRAVINKGNTESELLSTIEKVFKTGWRQLKLYFMIGLPTETDEDVSAIITLVNKALDIGRRIRGGGVTITASISTFIPKPHTPFQWAKQIPIEETIGRQDILKHGLKRRGIELKWHDPFLSFLEGLFARGGRELAPVIFEAWKNGARFDAWDEQVKFDLWEDALAKNNIDGNEYVGRERKTDEVFPWDHLFTELDRKFLAEEYKKAMQGESTEDCVRGACSVCGVCDFKEIKNRVY